MPPIGETTPASETSDAAASILALPARAPTEIADPTRDFVGWTVQPEFRNSRRLSVEVTRKVLATALGLKPEALAPPRRAQLRAALDRLRAMAAYTQKLAEVAATDDLTGALRRSAGLAALQREIDRSRRVGGKGIAVIFLDVDSLKHVNDTAGSRGRRPRPRRGGRRDPQACPLVRPGDPLRRRRVPVRARRRGPGGRRAHARRHSPPVRRDAPATR